MFKITVPWAHKRSGSKFLHLKFYDLALDFTAVELMNAVVVHSQANSFGSAVIVSNFSISALLLSILILNFSEGQNNYS